MNAAQRLTEPWFRAHALAKANLIPAPRKPRRDRRKERAKLRALEAENRARILAEGIAAKHLPSFQRRRLAAAAAA